MISHIIDYNIADQIMQTLKRKISYFFYLCYTIFHKKGKGIAMDYTCCTLCPRNCRIDRTKGQVGFCGMSDTLRVARASLHMWEEPCLSSKNGSGTVFFSGCNMRCIFCQNYEISTNRYGKEITVTRLKEIFLELQEKGAHNINLVTPTPFLPSIVEALKIAKQEGLVIPIVYNSSGYEKVSVLKQLEGLIDIYLPDMKYVSETLSSTYSKARDYHDVAILAIQEMVRQVGPCVFDEDGVMKKGVIVRHLLLPNQLEDSKRVLFELYHLFHHDIWISIMNQYTPLPQVNDIPSLNRVVTEEEYNQLIDYAFTLGIRHAFVQEGGTASESFIPLFDFEGV